MEVIVLSDSVGDQACISFWNPSTGVKLKSYKNGVCGKNGFCMVGEEFILCTQYEKQLIHIYDAQKEHLLRKIVCPGKITCMSVSPCQQYCLVGLQEKIYIWQICTGNLINVLSKHYQAVTDIKFTVDGSFFVTVGDDNLILIWNFANVLQPKDALSTENISEQPMFTLSNHSMPITSCCVGVTSNRCHFATSSLDQTCKVFNLVSGKMLCSIVFDMACTAVTMDHTETRLFAGTADGRIYVVNLFKQKPDVDNHISNEDTPHFKAHSKAVTSLSISMDDTKLLSGSKDGDIKMWHINSKQCLKTITCKGEVTNAHFLTYPKFMNEDFKSNASKITFANFKRTIHTPVENIPEWKDMVNMDSTDMYPVLLKDIPLDEDDNTYNENACFNAVLQEFVAHQQNLSPSSTSTSLHTATRAELLDRINTLESMSQEFYKFACQTLVNKKNIDTDDNNVMETG